MSKLRSINTVIWSDPWFEILEPSAKLLFIYLVTNEKTNMLGVYEISIRKVSFETGITAKEIQRYLKEFEVSKKIRYAENRVLLLNFLKHQNYNFNMMKSAIRTYNELPKSLKVDGLQVVDESKEGFETLCNGFAGVRKYEYEYEYEDEDEDEDEDSLPTKVDVLDFDKLLIFINQTFGKEYRVINEATKKSYRARMKEGYKKIDVMNAVKNCKKNKTHIDQGFQYATPEFFSRSKTIEKYMNEASDIPRDNSNSRISHVHVTKKVHDIDFVDPDNL